MTTKETDETSETYEVNESNKKALTLGERIRNLRHERDMTLPEVARLTGLMAATLSDIERSRIVSPSVFTVQKIARALNVDLSFLLEGEANFSEQIDPRKILPLLKNEYLQLLQDEKFQGYFAVAQRAYTSGIDPDLLDKMVDVIALKK